MGEWGFRHRCFKHQALTFALYHQDFHRIILSSPSAGSHGTEGGERDLKHFFLLPFPFPPTRSHSSQSDPPKTHTMSLLSDTLQGLPFLRGLDSLLGTTARASGTELHHTWLSSRLPTILHTSLPAVSQRWVSPPHFSEFSRTFFPLDTFSLVSHSPPLSSAWLPCPQEEPLRPL